METKTCITCLKEKLITDFSFRKDCNKYCNSCKKCKCIIAKKYYKKNKEKVKAYQKEYSVKNKGKIKEKNKKYYKLNKEKILKKNYKRRENNPSYQRSNYLKNRNDRLAYAQKYRAREDVKDRRNEMRKKRLKEDVCYRLSCRASSSIRKYLKKNKCNKNGDSFFKKVGYTVEDLKIHIESQFEDWMSWDNWGVYKINGKRVWNIDHVIPQHKFYYESMDDDQFKKCWALKNLRPLCALENIKRNYEESDEKY